MTLGGVIFLALLALLVIFAISLYNRLVGLGQRSEEAWSGIDVQLKRRADLVPNLVETVKGYAAHEQSTLDQVIRARGAAVSATTPETRARAENQLTDALRQLFVLAEAYPDLKADANYRSSSNPSAASRRRSRTRAGTTTRSSGTSTRPSRAFRRTWSPRSAGSSSGSTSRSTVPRTGTCPRYPSAASRLLKKARLLRWRPRPHAQRPGSTPRVRPSAPLRYSRIQGLGWPPAAPRTATHPDLFEQPAEFFSSRLDLSGEGFPFPPSWPCEA